MLKNSVKPDFVWLVDKPIKKFLEMESKIMK